MGNHYDDTDYHESCGCHVRTHDVIPCAWHTEWCTCGHGRHEHEPRRTLACTRSTCTCTRFVAEGAPR